MKKFILIALSIFTITLSYSQSESVATLQHGGEMTTYYGLESFINAYNDASDGDVIALSSGLFKSTNITKGITIRGAGCYESSDKDVLSTVISGNCSININSSKQISMEGLLFYDGLYFENVTNSQFVRCYISGIGSNYEKISLNNVFYHCYINGVNIRGENTFISCVIQYNNDNTEYKYNFRNCIVYTDYYMYQGYSRVYASAYSSTFRDCIILNVNNPFETFDPVNNTTAYNCLCIGSTNNIFSKQLLNNTNTIVNLPLSSIFKTYDGSEMSIDNRYELTDSAATVFLGRDSSQVGIYGGAFPFTTAPSYPIISKFEVANKTDSNGKIRIVVEVKSAQ